MWVSLRMSVEVSLCESMLCWSPLALPATDSAPPPLTSTWSSSALVASPSPNAVVLPSPCTSLLSSPCTLLSPRMLPVPIWLSSPLVTSESRMSPPAATAPSPDAVVEWVSMSWSTSPPWVRICWFTESSTSVSRSSTKLLVT